MIDYKDILLYDKDAPMLFSGAFFWFFFAVVLFGYTLLYKKNFARTGFLFLMSLFFYYKSGGYFFTLLLFSTLVDYYIGKYIHRTEKPLNRKLLLAASIFINLALLAYFKYYYFFVDTVNGLSGTNYEVLDHLSLLSNTFAGTEFDISSVILPVGISFYTFQTISYSFDIYRKKLAPVKNMIDFGFYVTFFPQLIAGPIVRAADFIPQLYQKFSLTKEEFGHAVYLILIGLTKKMVISDYISINFVDRVFDAPLAYSGFENLMGLYGYAIQIYCDFSGYTDIAIGVSLLLGFRLLLNFNSPYKAENITDFWRRWHISLSSWLKDYLYISLGGNQKSSVFVYLVFPFTLAAMVFVNSFSVINLSALGILIGVWVLSLIFKQKKIFRYLTWAAIAAIAYLMLDIYTLLGKTALVDPNWYAFWFLIVTLVSWVLTVIFPKIKVKVTTMINLLLTMLLGGLWHGANIKFIIWGAIHGVALALDKIRIAIYGNAKKLGRIEHFIAVFFTFHVVCFAWLYFRAGSRETVDLMLDQMFYHFGFELNDHLKTFYLTSVLFASVGFIVYRIIAASRGEYSRPNRVAAVPFLIFRDLINLPLFNLAVLFAWHVVFFGVQFIGSYFGYVTGESLGLAVMPEMLQSYRIIFLLIAVGFIIHLLPVSFKELYRGWFIKIPMWSKVLVCVLVVLILYQAKSSDVQPFIYFQF